MGLLDDAIRAHLELKRQAGADPGEIARVEREALDPSFEPEATVGVAVGLHDGGREGAYEQVHLSQETAELDMASVLREDAAISLSGQDDEEPSSELAEGDSLEWEMPMGITGSTKASASSRQQYGDDTSIGSDDMWRDETQSVHAGLDRAPDALSAQTPGQERLSLD